MRHRKLDKKFGRSPEHRERLIASQVCSLILRQRIKTTLKKAKVTAGSAEKMVTLARGNTLASRRVALSRLRDEKAVQKLFADIVPAVSGRSSGYTRIVKLGRRISDGSEMALLEWIDAPPPERRKRTKKSESAGSTPDKA